MGKNWAIAIGINEYAEFPSVYTMGMDSEAVQRSEAANYLRSS